MVGLAVSRQGLIMRLRLGQLGRQLQEDIFIRRGTGGYGSQGGGYKVAISGTDVPRAFKGLVDVDSDSTFYDNQIQSHENTYYVMFIPAITVFQIDGESQQRNLQKGDQLVRRRYIPRSPKQTNETDNQHLIRDIRNTNDGVLTVSLIEEKLDVVLVHAKDITESIS